MKRTDIKVGEHYEVMYLGAPVRAIVRAVEKRERRVYSGERWDSRGHMTTGWVVDIEIPPMRAINTVTPQQVKRPWAEAAPEHEEKAALKERTSRAISDLKEHGYSAWVAFGTGPGYIDLRLTLDEAEALAKRLDS